MSAKAHQTAEKTGGQAIQVAPVPARPVRLLTVAAPYLDILARESAKSIGRQMGPTLKWVVVGLVTSGGAVTIASVITGILAR